ncbi:MAG: Fic family protein, partial [bacterium]|nr:Fic family protein [bacterium]
MSKRDSYQPPYALSPAILNLVADISEEIGRYAAFADNHQEPRLRRENRLRTIQASLSIENNTLSLEQVTAVVDGRRILGDPREIQEVRNAFSAYEAMEDWQPDSSADMLTAHRLLMAGLVDDAGRFRSGGVGVFRGDQLVHMAPPAKRIPRLIANLLNWLQRTDEHPLVASCVFHYEFEFIHP